MTIDLPRFDTPLRQNAEPRTADGNYLSMEKHPIVSENYSAAKKPTSPKPPEKIALPKLKSPGFSDRQNFSNQSLAMNLLQEMTAIVAGWQGEIQDTLAQIQDVYLEGPLVDGWLESHHRQPTAAGEVLPAKTDGRMNYVAEILPEPNINISCQSPRTGYRLCGFDENGKMWSRPCPPEQLASVGVAIARYQKLRQLIEQKHFLETRLNQLAETLVMMHHHLD